MCASYHAHTVHSWMQVTRPLISCSSQVSADCARRIERAHTTHALTRRRGSRLCALAWSRAAEGKRRRTRTRKYSCARAYTQLRNVAAGEESACNARRPSSHDTSDTAALAARSPGGDFAQGERGWLTCTWIFCLITATVRVPSLLLLKVAKVVCECTLRGARTGLRCRADEEMRMGGRDAENFSPPSTHPPPTHTHPTPHTPQLPRSLFWPVPLSPYLDLLSLGKENS